MHKYTALLVRLEPERLARLVLRVQLAPPVRPESASLVQLVRLAPPAPRVQQVLLALPA